MNHEYRNVVGVTIAGALALAIAGCGREQRAPVATGSRMIEPSVGARTDQTIPKSQGNLSIAENIRLACGISDADAYFAFDSAAIDGRARAVLAKIAECFRSGPLRGKKLTLIGHADPRGDSEYNMVLGGERATSVENVLVNRGLPSDRISTTSRGEMDASGTNEQSWAHDRRVDVTLGS